MSFMSCSVEEIQIILAKEGWLHDDEVYILAELLDACDAGLMPKSQMYRKGLVVAERELLRRIEAEESIEAYERIPGAISDLRERTLKRLERTYERRFSERKVDIPLSLSA
jgi:hypothetical protein